MALTDEQVMSLKYKVENPFLREWSMKYGVIDCMTKVQSCLKAGFGFMGSKRIDRSFVESLSYNDRCLYNGVVAWSDIKNDRL